MKIVMSVKKWEFDVQFSGAVLTWVVIGWSVLPLCPLRSQL